MPPSCPALRWQKVFCVLLVSICLGSRVACASGTISVYSDDSCDDYAGEFSAGTCEPLDDNGNTSGFYSECNSDGSVTVTIYQSTSCSGNGQSDTVAAQSCWQINGGGSLQINCPSGSSSSSSGLSTGAVVGIVVAIVVVLALVIGFLIYWYSCCGCHCRQTAQQQAQQKAVVASQLQMAQKTAVAKHGKKSKKNKTKRTVKPTNEQVTLYLNVLNGKPSTATQELQHQPTGADSTAQHGRYPYPPQPYMYPNQPPMQPYPTSAAPYSAYTPAPYPPQQQQQQPPHPAIYGEAAVPYTNVGPA